MRKITYLFVLLNILLTYNLTSAQTILYGNDAKRIIPGTEMIVLTKGNVTPTYFKFTKGSEFLFENLNILLYNVLKVGESFDNKLINSNKDELGNIHYRYELTYENVPIHDAQFLVHVNNGKIYAVNGNFYRDINISNTISFSENTALQKLLNKINAHRYKWQMPEEEKLLQEETKNLRATYYPKGELVLLKDKVSQQYIYTYSFNVYADKPLKRAIYYVDASTGKIVFENNLIHEGNANGTAVTKYSGTQSIKTDSTNPTSFRLRETLRGQGIETYNMLTGTNYGNSVDFTDSDNNWNNVNAAKDEVATDAHWGAEKTWDYFWYRYERNSIDNLGFKIKSYIHYDVSYANAFWDGQRMTYGDGNSSWQPLVALDICAHEITHGLTSYSANLDYESESGAMNEAFSDIFGTAIEFYAKPSTANWLIGSDIGTPLRSMSNPNTYNDPGTYGGNFWINQIGCIPSNLNDNCGVHTNSGVLNHWFYLLSVGGSGTNEFNQTYNISGVGVDTAGAIAFRLLTVYLTNTSKYSDARLYAIIAAADLYGNCSQAVQSVTNAFYAVGVGNAYTPGVQSDFVADNATFCQSPAYVTFINQSNNGLNYVWDFGDGATSNLINPTHVYNNYGAYNVKLSINGGICGIDSIIKQQYISVFPSNPCVFSMPQTGSLTANTCNGILYDNGGNNFYLDNTDVTTVISPIGATSVTLTFSNFSFETNSDFLYIYDGNSVSSPLIGKYSGNTLPNGGTITSTSGSITLRQTSDASVSDTGFIVNWLCSYPAVAPDCNFRVSDTSSCTGVINFIDISTNGPNNWLWDFGDGITSNIQNTTHTYQSNGIYNVKLYTSNAYGSDSLIKFNIISINKPADPIIPNDTANCGATSFTFHASGNGIIKWFNTPIANLPIDTGFIFNTNTLNSNTTYYVESQVSAPSTYGGKIDTSGGGSYFNNSSIHYLVFDCLTPSVLKSVKVYAKSAKSRTFQLQNNSGSVLATKTLNVPAGSSRVILNFNIPAENNLRLVGPSSPDLYRNNAGTNYPYQIGNKIVIKSSSATQDPTGYFYFFYDWEVQGETCRSNRLPLNVYINSTKPTPSYTYTSNNLNVSFTNTTVQGVNYLWNFGDGTTSVLTNPTHTYGVYGNFEVKLTATNACGIDTITKTINVEVSVNENNTLNNLNIYPNPTNSLLYIHFPSSISGKLQMQLLTMTGQLIWDSDFESSTNVLNTTIDMSKFAKGIYYLKVKQQNQLTVKKVIKL